MNALPSRIEVGCVIIALVSALYFIVRMPV
jgi:hypothetical protein